MERDSGQNRREICGETKINLFVLDGFLSTWTNMDSDHQIHFILDLQTLTSTFQVFTISISRNSTHNIETWPGRGNKKK